LTVPECARRRGRFLGRLLKAPSRGMPRRSVKQLCMQYLEDAQNGPVRGKERRLKKVSTILSTRDRNKRTRPLAMTASKCAGAASRIFSEPLSTRPVPFECLLSNCCATGQPGFRWQPCRSCRTGSHNSQRKFALIEGCLDRPIAFAESDTRPANLDNWPHGLRGPADRLATQA
jgi:hypothetical protein